MTWTKSGREPAAPSVGDQVRHFAWLGSTGLREVAAADQKVPAIALDRYKELAKEWTSTRADAEKAMKGNVTHDVCAAAGLK